MRVVLRFVLPLLLVLGGIAWLAAPALGELIEKWFRADVEMRSRLIFTTVNDNVVGLVKAGSTRRVDSLFRQIAKDERVLALGLCTGDGTPSQHSAAWPSSLSCPAGEGFSVAHPETGAVLAASFALNADGVVLGHLVILHDLDFIERRLSRAENYLAAFLALLGLAAAGVTAGIARLTLRAWTSSLLRGLKAGESGSAAQGAVAPELTPLLREIRKAMRGIEAERGLSDSIRVEWGPDSLRNLLRAEMPEAEVLVVSNRQPYIHNMEDGKVRLQRPASGLVTALEPIMRACGGTWIAHGSGSADSLMVDARDRLAVPPDAPAYTLRRVWLNDEEQDGYYYGLANEGLWPLCHIAFVRPTFRTSDWQQYVAVNRKFADAVVAEATTPNPVVLVQDYHFALLPQMVRHSLPEATIVTFWHIPWPNPEMFSICPWREEILAGLLGSSILGFHTQFHCLNFLESVDRFLASHIDRELSVVRDVDGNTTLVRPYPISIEWPPAALTDVAAVVECQNAVRRLYDIAPDVRLAVGVERFDYTKGIADRFRAVQSLLEQYPHWIGHFTLLQVAAPTRGRLAAYQITQEEAESLAAEINQRFGRDGWRPIRLVARHHEPDEVLTLFRAADLCLVSSLHDGMNLVAKEFVAARDDEDGVLILSTFAGASRELLEALIVNPYDIQGMAAAIHAGLTMPADQRRERMKLMRALVSEHNIHHWAGRMLLDAARIRKSRAIQNQMRHASASAGEAHV